MIGRPLVEMLINRGATIRTVGLDSPDLANPNTEYIRCDLTYLDNCLRVCEGMDIVFNLLCTKGSPKTGRTKPASYFVQMVMYNTNLMEASRRMGAKSFLFTSSVCVYPPAEIFYEHNPLLTPPSENDRGAGWAKRMGEFQAHAYGTEYGWKNISIVRPSNVYGPYDNFEPFNSMIIPSLIRQAVDSTDKIYINGDGSAERDFIFCEDVARGMLLAVEKQLPSDYPINLGVGHGVSIKDLAELVIKISGKKLDLVCKTSEPSGDKKRIFDLTRATSVGFKTQISLEEGLSRTYRWYLENHKIAEKRYDIFKQSRIN